MKIKKKDNVIMIAGKDKGKTGIVENVIPAEGKIVVAGINIFKKSVKPSKKSPKGGIIEINAKFDSSNAMVVCPSCSKPTRVGYEIQKGKKMRLCKKCKASLEVVK